MSLTIVINIIDAIFSAEPAAIFRIDLKKEIEQSFETSASLIQMTWRHSREERNLQAYTKTTVCVDQY